MVGELITLPVRIGVRATRLWLRAAEEMVGVAGNVTGQLIGAATGRRSNGGSIDTSHVSAPTDSGAAGAEPHAPGGITRERSPGSAKPFPPASIQRPIERPAAPPSSRPEPAHVSSEPELVEEFAEPGAEDGAGAEVRIDEPWDGYARMNAKQVISRLATSSAAELAAVQLYESMNRRRQTILNAVQREQRRNGSGSPIQ
jgi:hypothetical protein